MSELIRPSLAEAELGAGKDFVIAEWRAEPSANPVAPLHVHLKDDEAWYVLEGSLGFSFDGEEFEVASGGAALAKAGVVHTYWNAADITTRYLIITTPKIRDLIAVLHDAQRRQGRTMAELFADYDSRLIE
ncbi:MAG TPA: cupin domain-containing protein [Microlunatus sp.]